jgi:hypothetical protein
MFFIQLKSRNIKASYVGYLHAISITWANM